MDLTSVAVGWEASRGRCGIAGRLKVQAGQEGRGVADLVLVTGQGALRQAPDELVGRQVQPDHRGVARESPRGAGPGGRLRSFGAKGRDENDGPARPQIGVGQAEQRVVARVPGQPGQGGIIQVTHADQVGHHPGQRAGRDVEIQEGGAELGSQGRGQRALARRRRAADQYGGESGQGRASAVAAVGLSGSDGSRRAW